MSILTTNSTTHHQQRPFAFGAIAFTMWGFFPIYWKLLAHVSPFVILTHRVLWSWVFLCCIQSWRLRTLELFAWPSRQQALGATAVSLLLFVNWFTFISAVVSGHIVESSLGYFLSPLLTILLGRFVLDEHLSPTKRNALILASLGLLFIVRVNTNGGLWYSLAIAGTWTCYGFYKKRLAIRGLASNQFESFITLPAALILLQWTMRDEQHVFTHLFGYNNVTLLLLIFGGVLTATPLMLFAKAVEHLQLSTIGFLNFLVPCLQFFCGAVIFHEAVNSLKLAGIALVSLALLFVLHENWRTRQDASL